MRQKRNSKIILIAIILLVILILIAGGIYAYFATDIFKSNKELFFKYVTQMGDKEEGFIEANLKEYFEKKKNTPYINEGSLSVNVTDPDNQEQFENINNMNVTFDGQVDTTNSQLLQDISINYSDRVKFPFSFKQIGNTIGIQTKYVGSKYIAVDKDELQNTEESFEKLEEFSNVTVTQEDLQHIKDTYFNVLNEQLQDSNFSKIEEANNKGYRLTLTGEELKSLIIKLLETLKNDQVTLDKMNEYLKIYKNSAKVTASDIDNLIKDINNNSEIDDKNIEITVYQEKQKTSKLTIKIDKEATIQIEKNITGNSQQYNISLEISQEDAAMKINLSANYSGVQLLQSITENYELNIEYEEQQSSSSENSVSYRYNFINNIDFSDSINIETFSNNNSMLLNDYEEEQVASFMQAVKQRLEETSKKQMAELGLEENENPLQYAIPQLGIYASALNAVNTNNISEEEVATFNSKFENYESTNLQGVTVKGLLSTIQLNNESQEDDDRKIKEIHFDGQEYEVTDQNITLIKSSVETETAYRVEFERDEDTGLIYRAVINKK